MELSQYRFIFNFRRNRQQMGNTCTQAQSTSPELPYAKHFSTPGSTGAPFDDNQANPNPLTQSRLLLSRTGTLRRADGLNGLVKSRLSQLPSLVNIKRHNFGEDRRVRLNDINADYVGQCQGNIPSGFGALQFDNGEYLQGQFVDGRCCGRGRFIRVDGSYYEGDMRNNVADGFGKYIDRNGYRYEGQWKNNQSNGRGQARYPDGSTYNGHFLNNRRHGKGVLMQGKSIFEGQFAYNQFEGEGTMRNEAGETYEGGWMRNEMHGKGVYCWPNGNQYSGQYRNGKREGNGKMSYPNGQNYEGQWLNGVKHGKGNYRTAKYSISGVWKNGELIEQIQRV